MTMSKVVIWEGVCWKLAYPTQVCMHEGDVCISQGNNSDTSDCIVLHPSEAIDIAFAILRDLAPTVHETLEKLNAKS